LYAKFSANFIVARPAPNEGDIIRNWNQAW